MLRSCLTAVDIPGSRGRLAWMKEAGQMQNLESAGARRSVSTQTGSMTGECLRPAPSTAAFLPALCLCSHSTPGFVPSSSLAILLLDVSASSWVGPCLSHLKPLAWLHLLLKSHSLPLSRPQRASHFIFTPCT